MSKTTTGTAPGEGGLNGKPVLLALDPGKTTGWAALDSNAQVVSGVLSLRGDLDERLVQFFHWLNDRVPTLALLCERTPGIRGQSAIHSLLGVISVARLVAAMNEVPFILVTPKAAKVSATGNGNAKKADVLAWAQDKYGPEIVEEDRADALAILSHWERING